MALLQPFKRRDGSLYKEGAGLKFLPPQEGLICNLDMEKIVGTTIYDRTGNGRNFINYNSPLLISGIKGLNHGLDYTGTSNYSNSGVFSLFDYTTFTMECWMYYDGTNDQVVHCGDSSGQTGFLNNNFISLIVATADDTVRFRSVRKGTLSGIISNISTGYNHFVMRIKNGNRLAGYINGVLIDEIDCVFPIENVSGNRSIDINRILRTQYSTVYYKSKVFGLRVWDRELSQKEITYLYNNGYGIK